MIISYLGLESVKLQFGDTTIAYNPVSKSSKFKSSSYGADIVLVSANHPDFNGVEQATRGEKAPFVISGPGEYEFGGIFVNGFQSETQYGKEKLINTIYMLNLENMNLCFLGPVSSSELIPQSSKEGLEDIDILFLPIGGTDVLDASSAYKFAVKLEPKIIIPLHFEAKSPSLKTFLKEGGEEAIKPVDKLTIKRKDLEGKEGDIVVIEPQN